MPDDTPLEPGDAGLDWHDKERNQTNEAIKDLRALDGTKDIRDVWTAAAIVGAHSNRELAAVTMAAADTVAGDLRASAGHLDAASAALAARIDAFTTATDASTRKLTTWTMVMAIATGALVLTGIAQILVTVLHK